MSTHIIGFRSEISKIFYLMPTLIWSYVFITLRSRLCTKLKKKNYAGLNSEHLYMHVRMHAHTIDFVPLNFCTKN